MHRTKVLFVDSTGALIVSKFNIIYKVVDDNFELVCELPVSFVDRFLKHSKLYYRAKRLGVGASVEYDRAYYFSFDKKIYRYDLISKELTVDFIFEQGRGPLSFTVVKDLPGFLDGLYFGEYISNRSKRAVSIYFRDDSWHTIYNFNDGEINHVHSLVVDYYSSSIWILTGDFGDAAAIFNTKDGFTSVDVVVSGSQLFRSCVAFPTKRGLLYGTDSQIEPNSIRLLTKVGGKWKSVFLFDLNGSCIYGCELKNYYVFSTSTEPTELVKNKFHYLIDNKPAPAIKDNRSDIILCSKVDFSFNIIYSIKKDFLPYRLFQFGTIIFPTGVSNNNIIYAYQIGAISGDLDTVILNCEQI